MASEVVDMNGKEITIGSKVVWSVCTYCGGSQLRVGVVESIYFSKNYKRINVKLEGKFKRNWQKYTSNFEKVLVIG